MLPARPIPAIPAHQPRANRVGTPVRLAIIVAAVLVAACGGAGGAATAPAGPTSGGAGGAATQAPGGATPTQVPGAVATQAPGGGQASDACALLGADDIREVTGLEIASATAGPAGGVYTSGCHWVLADGSAVVPAEILLGVMPTGGRDHYDTSLKPFLEDLGYEPIEGLGDAAAAGAGSAMAVSGDTIVDVQYIALEPTDVELATELLRKALGHLGR